MGLLTRLLTELSSSPGPVPDRHVSTRSQKADTVPAAIDDRNIVMLPGVGRDTNGDWKCNYFYTGRDGDRELCGDRFSGNREFLEHRRVAHRLDETVIIIESERYVGHVPSLQVCFADSLPFCLQRAVAGVQQVWFRVLR